MRTILAVFITILFLFPISAMGEILTIKQTVKQTFGGGQSADDARIYGIAKAKREALEKAGTYIESLTIVKDAKVEKDEILALTAGVLKAEVISQKNYALDDAFGIELVINVVVDTSVLEERVKKQLQDREHLTQLKEVQKREKELLQKVAKLEEENQKLLAEKYSTKQLMKEFQQASQGLASAEWFYQAYALLDSGKYTNPKKAIEYLNNAIRLQPNDAGYYNNRGVAYDNLGQYQRAIEDYNEAIRLKPDFAYAYYNRGGDYKSLGRYERAIEDYNESIRIKPNDAESYGNRGVAYAKLGQHQRAIEDYNEGIRLKPDDAAYYYNRGIAYRNLGQPQRAIADYNEAIRLQPNDAVSYGNRGLAYDDLEQYQLAINDYSTTIRLKPDDAKAYYSRGLAYAKLGQYQLTIADCNAAIRLKPDYTDAYKNRGYAYLLQGNKIGCPDAQKVCELGDCKLLEWSKGNGLCR